jgi:phosphatidylglycerol lysyltransferase
MGQKISFQTDLVVKRFVGLIAGVILFLFALLTLHRELTGHSFFTVVRYLESMPTRVVLLSFGLVLFSYATLTLYDLLALRFIGKTLPYRKTVFTSFVSYAVSNTVGFSFLSGAALRLRLYGSWGLSALDIAQVTLFNATTLGVGLALGAGVALLAVPPMAFLSPGGWRGLGGILLLGVSGYLSWCTLYRRTWRWREWEISPPSGLMAGAQVGVSLLDWTFSGLALYVLLPQDTVSPVSFLGIFMVAQVAGLVSHVPGGVGVFETVFLISLRGSLSGGRLAAALLAYRGLYYVIPFLTAIGLLSLHEIRERRETFRKVAGATGKWVGSLTPSVLSLLVFTAGLVLLLSGATPPQGTRLAWLGHLVPLPFIEVSHFMGSLVGTGLLLLAWGLQRRLDSARLVTGVFVAVGAATALLKGGDYEEAIFLVFIFILLIPLKSAFYRRSRFTSEPLSPGWMAAVALALIGTVWLGFFAHRHQEYSNDLWWKFELARDAPRFLRGLVAMGGGLALFGFARLLRTVPPDPALPSLTELDRAAALAAASPHTLAWLALMGDKELLFSESGKSFLMFAVEGNTWVSMGDPIGDEGEWADLAWAFKDLADRHGGRAVFYEVKPDMLPLYLDLGLQLLKMGEEARVPLDTFSLEGPENKEFRYTVRKMEKEGLSFRVCPAQDVPKYLHDLKSISNQWLKEKNTREKRFSLGSFKEDFLVRFPLALAEKDGKIVAFSNLWPGGAKMELSGDLMRHGVDAPRGVMDYLFIQMMLWGKAEGYRWFNLGMAPFSGFETRPLAPLWQKLGGVLFHQGEYFYNFQGLRQYKEKFHPVWGPKYLASPGGLALPGILTNVASLISGGIRGILTK